MAKAIQRTTTIPISELTTDPTLRAFFRSGPDSAGFTVPAVAPVRPVPPLSGLVRSEGFVHA